ncbi:MAG: 6-carboxytetrahydropterin synthase QueD [Planctomycetota bacterium]|jgi:6-pyruvoyltetrahydropterin/6-carboxytetrahydropterin synthase|nr:6-carboxytetrahydropterin synthase QueD [Planctomycetota bacterium]
MYFLQVEDDFASAHQLRGYKGKCENLHGHNWRVRVRVRGGNLDALGMVMDFGDLKKRLKRGMDALDHKFLNETAPFDEINPTSENLARHLYEDMGKDLPPGVAVHEVTVWESEKCAATYSR